MKVHVGIVSEQTLANLIPILMERPDKVYLACSETMASRGFHRRLKRLLDRQAIGVEIRRGAPDTGLRDIQDYALSLAADIEKEHHGGAEIVLNATGGTKLMSLGFVEVFRGVARRIVYTDTSHSRIEVFPDGSGTAHPIEMRDVLDVPEYLAAQGLRYIRARTDDPLFRQQMDSRMAASRYLGRRIGNRSVQNFVGMINRSADEALEKIPGSDEERLAKPRQPLSNEPWGEWKDALAVLARTGLLEWRPGAEDIVFCDVAAAKFLHGGWLEEYAWHTVNEQRPFDARLGIDASWEGGRHLRNEFDVMAAHGNQLLYIECKTLRFREETESDIAYKVDSLGRDARGLFGETWLLSAREYTDVLVERAAQSGIRLLGPGELPHLRGTVRRWMTRG
jgi:hypothetical protein